MNLSLTFERLILTYVFNDCYFLNILTYISISKMRLVDFRLKLKFEIQSLTFQYYIRKTNVRRELEIQMCDRLCDKLCEGECIIHV